MTVALPPLAMGVNSSADPGVLHTIGLTGVSLTLWDRRLPQELSAALDELPPEQLPRMRRRLAVRDVPGAVRAACVEAGAICLCRDAIIQQAGCWSHYDGHADRCHDAAG